MQNISVMSFYLYTIVFFQIVIAVHGAGNTSIVGATYVAPSTLVRGMSIMPRKQFLAYNRFALKQVSGRNLTFGSFSYVGPASKWTTRSYLEGGGLPGPTLLMSAGQTFKLTLYNTLQDVDNPVATINGTNLP